MCRDLPAGFDWLPVRGRTPSLEKTQPCSGAGPLSTQAHASLQDDPFGKAVGEAR